MTDYNGTIEAMAAACDELRRASGQDYASATLEVNTTQYGKDKTRNQQTEWRVYSEATRGCRGETLAQAVELALQRCGPAEMLAKAKQLRAEADKLEAKAREGVAA